MKVMKESTWAELEAELEVSFTKSAQDKLRAIIDAGSWDEMEDEIYDNCPAIYGVFSDMYRIPKKSYTDFTEDEIKKSRKDMFTIIDKYYNNISKDDVSESVVKFNDKSINGKYFHVGDTLLSYEGNSVTIKDVSYGWNNIGEFVAVFKCSITYPNSGSTEDTSFNNYELEKFLTRGKEVTESFRSKI